MNFNKTSLLLKLEKAFPFLQNFFAKKLAKRKGTLSTSVLDKRTPVYVPFILLLPAVILIAIFTIAPMVLNIINSLTTRDSNALTLENYSAILEDARFAVGVRNSFIYGIFVLPFVMAISLVVSSVIAKLHRRWSKGLWQSVFFMPYITNAVAISLTFIQVFSQNGLFNQIFGTNTDWLKVPDRYGFSPLLPMLVNGIWSHLAFNILIFTTAMMGVDKNLYRSASIDGCGEVKQFFKVTLPSIKGTINFLITLGIIGGIKVFPLALFENKPLDAMERGASTLMLYVYLVTKSGEFARSGAASILLFIIGVTFSTMIRGGFFMIQTTLNNLGERNVFVKVNNTKLMK
ncbi:carbohydrate ABC transporter permease [Mycoplasmopsis gallinacea]|uniref:sn-glycerol-3-phosphate transport system permease protein ugpA n=1 Tax=Mycoplasmopsis gallinacea TaxID=29556 RepID=A0A449A3Q4_9BACT|nr:sugar ABC transporter permease [Mycoplasmopsis gallinacea]VEU58876.1 sn-glycerol-3-phosphate transport system permease protein ugpA [Mycoplasmopsis gallinacea]